MTKFASHHLLYVVYMCQKSLNFTYAFKCYQQNVSGFTLAGPPCILVHIVAGWYFKRCVRQFVLVQLCIVQFGYSLGPLGLAVYVSFDCDAW